MLDNLKDWLLQRAIRKQNPRQARLRNYKDIRNVLLIYKNEPASLNAEILHIKDTLVKEGKEVTLFTLDLDKETTFLGRPKQAKVLELQQVNYDLLIDLTLEPCRPLHYLALYARADCKAGLELTHGILDFMIAVSKQVNASFLYEQIIRYLRIINSTL